MGRGTIAAIPPGTGRPRLGAGLAVFALALLLPGGERRLAHAADPLWQTHPLEQPAQRSYRAPLEKGDGARLRGGSDRVREVQGLFAVLGYPLGREARSGVFGVRTQGAVRYFQREQGLRATGRVDGATLARMQAEAAVLRRAARKPAPRIAPPVGLRASLTERLPELLALLVAILLAAVCLAPVRRRAVRGAGVGPARRARAEVDAALAALARPAGSPGPLGAMLLEAGALSPQRLREALRVQQRWGGRLGEILSAAGAVDPRVLRTALGVQLGFRPLVGDEHGRPAIPLDLARAARAVVLDQDGPAGASRVAFADPGPTGVATVARALGRPVLPVLADDASLDELLRGAYGEQDVAEVERVLQGSVRTRRRRRLRVAAAAVALLGVLGTGLWAAPAITVLALVAAVGVAQALGAGRPGRAGAPAAGRPVAARPLPRRPRYTVLLPVARASRATVEACVAACARLDYPPHLLEGFLLVPADDAATLAAVAHAELPPWLRVVAVPLRGRGDATALALYGLRGARGELTAVLDPHAPPRPGDLAAAAAALAGGQRAVVSLDGRIEAGPPGLALEGRLATATTWSSRGRRGAHRAHARHFETDAVRDALGWAARAAEVPEAPRLVERAA